MHLCSVCRKSCDCTGDTSPVVSIQEAPGCTCCINRCEHGIELGFFCQACELEDFTPEPNAAPTRRGINGGW